MDVGVAYADKFKHVWLNLDVPEGATVKQAIEKSGLLTQFPEIDLNKQKVGIFGKLTKLKRNWKKAPVSKSTDRLLPIRKPWNAGIERSETKKRVRA